MQLAKEEYYKAKAATKPTALALRLADKLFTVETLMQSTVHGNKEFAALDPKVLTVDKITPGSVVVLTKLNDHRSKVVEKKVIISVTVFPFIRHTNGGVGDHNIRGVTTLTNAVSGHS